MTCYAFEEATSKFLPFDKYRTALATLMENVSTATITTQMDYLEHDANDYDIYIRNPTAKDLPYLPKIYHICQRFTIFARSIRRTRKGGLAMDMDPPKRRGT